MDWDSGLLPEQKRAASETGCHVCLLAGPGTGKTTTLSRRVLYLVREKGTRAGQILSLTFTRAAAHELRQRAMSGLDSEADGFPRVSTLHSFALSQLLHNAPVITVVPRPLRIADDWEERNIIEEDLKVALNSRIRDVRSRFHRLSADWETLVAEGSTWEAEFPDPQFLGAWQRHREIYGYMLRSELVYRLKKSIEQNPDFTLDQFEHILVDEYQDLNRCDIEVVRALASAGGQLFVAGDDDQSIYCKKPRTLTH